MNRRFVGRSRQGCATCRARHVKCDEVRPTCLSCTKTGRKCEGYGGSECGVRIIQWRPHSSSLASRSPNPPLESLHPSSTAMNLMTGSKVSLDYFRAEIGLKTSAPFGSVLWSGLMLQAAMTEPAVSFAIRAISSLHKRMFCPDYIREDLEESLSIHARALHCLSQLLSNRDERSTGLAMLISFVCICFEILSGNYLAALIHLDSSLKIICKTLIWDERTGVHSMSEAIGKELLRAYLRFDLQAATYMSQRRPIITWSVCGLNRMGKNPGLDDAEQSLHVTISRVRSFIRGSADEFRYRERGGIQLPLISEMLSLGNELSRWYQIFEPLLLQKRAVSSRHVRHLCIVLLIQHAAASIEIETAIYAEESLYDRHAIHFARIVRLATEVSCKEASHQSIGTKFTFDMGIVYPLYLTALKCRHSKIRRQALGVMEALRLQEGVWSSIIFAKIARRVMALEEGDRAWRQYFQRVPEYRRIHGVGLDLDHTKNIAKVSCRTLLNGPDGEWDKQVFWISLQD